MGKHNHAQSSNMLNHYHDTRRISALQLRYSGSKWFKSLTDLTVLHLIDVIDDSAYTYVPKSQVVFSPAVKKNKELKYSHKYLIWLLPKESVCFFVTTASEFFGCLNLHRMAEDQKIRLPTIHFEYI